MANLYGNSGNNDKHLPATTRMLEGVAYMLMNMAAYSRSQTGPDNLVQARIEFQNYVNHKQGYEQTRNMLQFLSKTEAAHNPHLAAVIDGVADVLEGLAVQRGDR